MSFSLSVLFQTGTLMLRDLIFVKLYLSSSKVSHRQELFQKQNRLVVVHVVKAGSCSAVSKQDTVAWSTKVAGANGSWNPLSALTCCTYVPLKHKNKGTLYLLNMLVGARITFRLHQICCNFYPFENLTAVPPLPLVCSLHTPCFYMKCPSFVHLRFCGCPAVVICGNQLLPCIEAEFIVKHKDCICAFPL